MSGSWKFTRNAQPSGLPGFLRLLADALEGRPQASDGPGGELAGMPVADWRKLVLVAERSEHKDGGLELKLKAKRAHEVLVSPAGPDRGKDAGRPGAARQEPTKADSVKKDPAKKDPAKKEKYRQLKKRMQADLKVLERAVRGGILPVEETLESFLSLAEIMVEMDAAAHPDPEMARAGAAFLADALLLREAFHRHDLDGLAEILGRLDRRKSACHAQFK